jgi:exosome complex RNA-binding protein Rrp42 (RNase PH superfamily)
MVSLTCRVSAKVSAEVVRPRPDKPTEGLLLFNTEISPMASPAFEVGRYVEVGPVVWNMLLTKLLLLNGHISLFYDAIGW